MTLNEISKRIREIAKNGAERAVVYKNGRSWLLSVDEGEIEDIRAIDENYIVLDMGGFEKETVSFVSFQVKRNYERNKYEDERDTDEIEELNKLTTRYKGYFNEAEDEPMFGEYSETAERIREYINEDTKITVDLTAEQAMYLSLLAKNHYSGSHENMGTRKPIFLVQERKEELRPAGYGEKDLYIVSADEGGGRYESLDEVVRAYYGGDCPIEIKTYEEAWHENCIMGVDGTEYCVCSAEDYLEAYNIGWTVQACSIEYGWETRAYFFIREEAERYLKYQGHNLENPRIYADGMGYGNKGEYEKFYDLLMMMGEKLNGEL